MDANTLIVSAVKDMAAIISTVLGTPDIDTKVVINDVTVFDNKK